MAAQSPIVAGGGRGSPDQSGPGIHRLDHRDGEKNKTGHAKTSYLRILGESLVRIQEVQARIGAEGPVDMFARAVDSVEGLFVQQGGHSVAVGYLAQGFHH